MMKVVSTKVPEETAEKLDRIVLLKQLKGEEASKSDVLRSLLEEWVRENEHVLDEFDSEGENAA